MSRISISTQEGFTNKSEIELSSVGSVAGVEIITNNIELKKQIQILPPDGDLGLKLSYITGSIDPLLLGLPESLEPMQVGHNANMGHLYVHENLKDFSFMGLEKLGTLNTIAYSIRTFAQIENAKLGMHSSIVVSPEGRGVLFIGASRSGKTRLALEWVKTHTDWQILEDDWSEISLNNGRIKPISPIKNVAEAQPNSFRSFDKNFVPKKAFELQRTVFLDSVVVIGADELSAIMSSLPFVDNNSITSDCRTEVRAEINRRLQMIRMGYSYLLTNYRRMHIADTVDVSDLSNHMEQLSKFFSIMR